ncbi:MAG: 30S ribosomal protein S20 [candidate division KSB1 bacterium]|nr:30S ribosomal protein S20 [candidate division KSB1 bacterium]
MPHHKSTQKRVKTNLRDQKYNTHYKSTMKSAIKKVMNTSEKEDAEKELKRTYSLLDKLAKKRVIHPNKAANQKARLAKRVNGL